MAYVYPQSDLDHGDKLLSLLGSTWSLVFEGRDHLTDYLRACAELANQTQLQANEVLDSLSRFSVPIYHRRDLDRVALLETQKNSPQTNVARYGQDYVYGNQPDGDLIRYGTALNLGDFAFPLPSQLVDVPVLQNAFKNPTVVLLRGIDYLIDRERGALVFLTDPFENIELERRDVYTGSEVTDQELVLWGVGAEYDWEQIYRRWGYALGIVADSSENYRQLVNAIFDGLNQGTARRHVEAALSAVCDIPLTHTDGEVVELVTADEVGLCVVTDAHVYRFAETAEAVVAVGDELRAGQPLTEGLRLTLFNDGEVPTDLQALAVGRSYLSFGYYGDLLFNGADVPLVVELDSNGERRLSFELGGSADDVTRFFDELHSKGLAAGETLADLLDPIPATINPLQFLIQNVLRNNAFLVRIKTTELGAYNMGLGFLRNLRRLTPPHTAMLILLELTLPGETVILDGPPTATSFGSTEYSELLYGIELISDTVDVADLLNGEHVVLNYVSGSCP